ncbi:MAG: multicopper oxidase family protein [Candidatus Sericytochromatia bacterium]|nr:multicopper oxidase family protein [Candidatus Sericytochromatia bacterium]
MAATPKTVRLNNGKQAELFTYNGQVPGPTIDAVEGQRVTVHFTNNLPEATTIHWHGLPVPPDQDGGPEDLVPPGGRRDYTFDVPVGSAGTYWYHPHPMDLTAGQVAKGLAGAFRVRAGADPVPSTFRDTLVMLSDLRLTADGRVSPGTQADKMNGREGDLVLVNGQVMPTLSWNPGEGRRLRVINASAARYYRLALPNHTLHQIGTDGGLFAKPVAQTELLLAPGERAEMLVQATGTAGTQSVLQALSYDRGVHVMPMGSSTPMSSAAPMDHSMHGMSMGTQASDGGGGGLPLMRWQYGMAAPAPMASIPALLRAVTPIATAGATPHAVVFTENMMTLDFRINGQKYQAGRADFVSKLGVPEIWQVENRGDMDHPFHLHGTQFQILDRNGVAEPFVAWKDTVNLRKGDVTRLAVQFDRYPGLRPFHCHILEHEDLGMMGLVRVE